MTKNPAPITVTAFLSSLQSIERLQHRAAILAAPSMKEAILYARSVGLDGYVARRIRYGRAKP